MSLKLIPVLTEVTQRWGPPRFSFSAASLCIFLDLTWYPNTIGEEGLLSLQSAMCTHNECVQTTSFSTFLLENLDETKFSIYSSFSFS